MIIYLIFFKQRVSYLKPLNLFFLQKIRCANTIVTGENQVDCFENFGLDFNVLFLKRIDLNNKGPWYFLKFYDCVKKTIVSTPQDFIITVDVSIHIRIFSRIDIEHSIT